MACLLLGVGLLASCSKPVTDLQLAQAQSVIDSVIIHNYLVKKGLTSVAKRDITGEYYIIDTLGTGSPLFSSSTLVTVGYTGRVLDSTYVFAQTDKYHPSFTLGQVIQGWQIGIPHVKKGGTIRLIIPSQYAYGPYPQEQLHIPANGILDFTIKLYDVNN